MHEDRISSAETGEEGSLHFQLLPSFCPSMQFGTVAKHTDSGSRQLTFTFWAAWPWRGWKSQEGRREHDGRSRPWGLPFHLLPSSGPQILNSGQARAGWTTLDLSMLARGQNEFHGVLVCLQGLQSYGVHLGSPWALRWALGRAELRESWRRIASVLFVPPSGSAKAVVFYIYILHFLMMHRDSSVPLSPGLQA